MKKIIALFSSAIVAASGIAQTFELEHTYSEASITNSQNGWKLLMVDFEQMGQHYVRVDAAADSVWIYDLDHQLVLTIDYGDIQQLSEPQSYQKDATFYFSQHLFDTDDGIEFMYANSWAPESVTQIVDQDGSILFTAENYYPAVSTFFHQQHYPIYNTSEGTKMVLCANSGEVRVYGIGGTWSGMATTTDDPSLAQVLIFPNPGKDKINISFPEALTHSALITLTSISGQEVASQMVSGGANSATLDVRNAAAGAYVLRIKGSVLNIAKRFVKE